MRSTDLTRLNILILATKYFGLGGAEAYTRMFAEAVAAAGGRVDVLSLLDSDAAIRFCPGRYLGDQGNRSTPWTQARFVTQAVRAARGYDLVVCSHVALGPVGHILFRLYHIPYVVIGYGIEVWGALGPRRRAALRRAARIIAISHFTARRVASVQGVPERTLSVIHPAVTSGLLREALADGGPPDPRGPVTLLTLARLSAQERYKGCDTVISTLPAVCAEVGPVRYVIAGDGDDLPRLRALAAERGVTPSVTFAGRVPAADLPALYRACHIFVMPSITEHRRDGWTGEGFGIVYIEAAAFGRPVIAGNGGGSSEAVRDGVTGYVVDGRDPAAVASALIRLARDGALRDRMGAAGKEWVHEHFTFDRFRREALAAVDAATNTGAS